MPKESHYPDYNVMNEQDAWDDHTQQIVTSRLVREQSYSFLSLIEAELLRSVCTLLAGDARADMIQYVLCHVDQTLSQNKGESERKVDIPKAQTLIREGLSILNQASMAEYLLPYFELDQNKQQQMLHEISFEKAAPENLWLRINQQAFFKKLLNLTIEAYYSHPTVWSEIGYGGPAYPRGYVRAQLGQLDPWEAKKNDDET
jgi:hypothetical protein